MKRKLLSFILASAMIFNTAAVPVMAQDIIQIDEVTEIAEEIVETEVADEVISDEVVIEESVIEDSVVEVSDVEEITVAPVDDSVDATIKDEDSAFIEEINSINEAAADYVLTEEQIQDKADLLKMLNETFLTDEDSVEDIVKTADANEDLIDSECSIEAVADSNAPYVKGEVVYLTDTYEDAVKVADSLSGTVDSYSYGVAVIKLPNNTTTAQVVCASALPNTNIPAVTPNIISTIEDYTVEAVPTDPYIFKEDAGNYQWFIDFVGAKDAWEKGYTGRGIKVAVLDTGLQRDHIDLTSNATAGKKFFGNDTGSAYDIDSGYHGTHVSGIIAADDNGQLGCGVAIDATVTGFAVLNYNRGSNSDIIRAMNAVIADGSYKIINMSLGSPSFDTNFDKAVTKAYNAGIAVICSAGNDGNTGKNYPGSYDNAICIAALDPDGKKADYSQYNSTVDYCFPGTHINACYSQNIEGYTFLNGTSMASPCAAGVAAVIMQARPDIANDHTSASVKNLRKIMTDYAIPAPSKNIGVGTTSLAKFVGTPITPPGTAVTGIELSGTTSIRAGKTFTVSAKVTPEDATNKGVKLVYKGTDKHISIKGMKVTASKKASGTYTVYAYSADGAVLDVPFTFNVTKGYITSIKLDKKSLSLFTVPGSSSAPTEYTLTKTVKGKSDYDAEAVKFVSSNPSVATVDEDGKITAVASGKTVITCKATDGSGKNFKCTVTVKVPMSGIKIGKGGDFSQTNIIVSKKKPTKLSIQAETAYGTPTSKAVKWSSDNAKIKIDKKGVVTVKKGTAAGETATITAKAADGSGLYSTVTVTVQ